MAPIIYKRQGQILDFIRQHIQSTGSDPTLRQIADAIGVSSLATVHEHLQTLTEKGLIKRKAGKSRTIEIVNVKVDYENEKFEAPILGYIAAGAPIEPYTDPNAIFAVPPTMVSSKKRNFVLQVKGDSMIEAGIYDKDYVVIEQTEQASNGEVVVALLDNGFATLKRFFKESTRVRLEPANSSMSPIFVTGDKVRIQGKCVGVIRKFLVN